MAGSEPLVWFGRAEKSPVDRHSVWRWPAGARSADDDVARGEGRMRRRRRLAVEGRRRRRLTARRRLGGRSENPEAGPVGGGRGAAPGHRTKSYGPYHLLSLKKKDRRQYSNMTLRPLLSRIFTQFYPPYRVIEQR